MYRDYGDELVNVNRTRSAMLTSVLQKFWLVDVFPFCAFLFDASFLTLTDLLQ